MSDDRTNRLVGDEDYIAIQRFLYGEARFLDRREYQRWLGLLTDDILYRVMARVTRDAEAGSLEYAIVDEDAAGLKLRVEQISIRSSPARKTRQPSPGGSSPISRRALKRRMSSRCESNLLIYRNRTNLPNGGLYVGERHDVLRRTNADCVSRDGRSVSTSQCFMTAW